MKRRNESAHDGLALEPHLRPEFAASAAFPQGASPTERVALASHLKAEAMR